MIDKKLVLEGLMWLLISFVLFGFALPFFFSMKSNDGVYAAFGLLLVFFVAAGNRVINLINNKNKTNEDEKND